MTLSLSCIRCQSPLVPILFDDDGTELVWICGCLALGTFNDRERTTARYWTRRGGGMKTTGWLLETERVVDALPA